MRAPIDMICPRRRCNGDKIMYMYVVQRSIFLPYENDIYISTIDLFGLTSNIGRNIVMDRFRAAARVYKREGPVRYICKGPGANTYNLLMFEFNWAKI